MDDLGTNGDKVELQRMTSTSREFRLKAARLARMAEIEPDASQQFHLIHQALSWIQVAENEELLTVGSEASLAHGFDYSLRS